MTGSLRDQTLSRGSSRQEDEETSRGNSGVLTAVPTAMDRHELGAFARSAAVHSFFPPFPGYFCCFDLESLNFFAGFLIS